MHRSPFIEKGSLPYKNLNNKLLFRGDDREPKLIFAEGLRRRTSQYEDLVAKIDEAIKNIHVSSEYEPFQQSIKQFIPQLKDRLLGKKADIPIFKKFDNKNQETILRFLKEEFLSDIYVSTNFRKANDAKDHLTQIVKLISGDDREPKLIFAEGLRRRTSQYEDLVAKIDEAIKNIHVSSEYEPFQQSIKQFIPQLKDRLLGKKADIPIFKKFDNKNQETILRFLKEEFLSDIYVSEKFSEADDAQNLIQIVKLIKRRLSEPHYDFAKGMGMDLTNSVSATLRMDVASHFPENSSTVSYIYFTRSNYGFLAYEHQEKTNPDYLYAQELAVRDIPRGDVIAAVKIKRIPIGAGSACKFYKLDGDITWNPLLASHNSPALEKQRQEIKTLVAARKNQYINTPQVGDKVTASNLQFSTINTKTGEEIEKYNIITKDIKDMVFDTNNNSAKYADQVIAMAHKLDDIEAEIIPGETKPVLQCLELWQSYVEKTSIRNQNPELLKNYEKVRNEMQQIIESRELSSRHTL